MVGLNKTEKSYGELLQMLCFK